MVHGPPGHRARCEHQGFETRGRSRARNPADRVLRPLVSPKHLAQAVLGMDIMERQRPLGLAVFLHWKGYLVVQKF